MDVDIKRNIVEEPEYGNQEPPKMLFYWQAVSRWALILFAGLAPVFFLPFTNLPVAVHKELLVFILTLAAFFALLGKILIEGKIRYPGHFFSAALLILVLVWGASAFFSNSFLTSLIGSFSTADSFASILIFAILASAAVAAFDRRDIIVSLLAFLASLSLLGVFELLQLTKIFVLPWSFAQNSAFNPVGSVNNLGVILAFGLIIASGLMAVPGLPGRQAGISKGLKRLLGISVLVFLINLIVIDFWAIWIGLALAMVLMISFISIGLSAVRRTDSPDRFAEPALQLVYFQRAWLQSVILLLAVLLLIIPSPISKFIQTPAEVSPTFSATLNIASLNLKAGYYLLGSGPNTFSYAFNLYKPPGINQTIFWATVFNAGASAMATWMATVGVFGILSLLLLIAVFIWTGIKEASARSASKDIINVAAQSVFVAVVFLFAMWFLYAANFTVMAFTFWGMGLFLAASLVTIRRTGSPNRFGEPKKLGFGESIAIFTSPPKTFLLSLLIVGLMVAAAAGVYFEANRYIAELYFGKGADVSGVSKAIQFWQYDERYFQSLAQLIFLQLGNLLSQKGLPQEELRTQFKNTTANAVAAAKRAEELDPKNPFNKVLLGSIYENLMPFVADASRFALSSYGAAVALDPQNPSNPLALARVEVAEADLATAQKAEPAQINNYLDKAVANLESAINLKNDYAPAIFLEVQVYDRQGKLADAIKRSEQLVMLNNTDVGSLFQLGFLYYKAQRFDESRQVFERTVELSPNYSNARYFLGLIYDREVPAGAKTLAAKLAAKAKAISQFEKIAELNPDNSEVKQILLNLKAGKAALFGIAPPAPAPQNRYEAPVSEGAKAPIKKLRK